ncbi:unnamed protein product [Brassicogethes aeneus]|uniref:tRNA (guanine-N(7)-)-methyltransferase non-catalytic subunit wuho n=1 Tax=Brassicogethes aeneus TaxID=1431903 RepID=A0A9P0F952_BRAAE|nr:unnamed protein product [Brassicogethes aeneus]
MVLLKKVNNDYVAASKESVVLFDLETETDSIFKIPEPILPENLTKGQMDVLKKEDRTITSLTFSKCEEYIAVTTENKQVVVFDKSLNVIKNFIVNRVASKILFTAANDVLIADKTGDVYLYKLKEDEPVLILGHLSVILDVVLSNCEKYIITCDRDEKIRVSMFPNAYNILSFCLGHKEFVTSLKILGNTLISASGDGTVRFWNYLNGTQLGLIDSNCNIKDTTFIEAFSKEMDEEKVDVTSLPITDMQVFNGGNVFIALSLYSVNGILLYTTNIKTFESTFVSHILPDVNVYGFCLDSKLLILSKTLYCYVLNGDSYNKFSSDFVKGFAIKHCSNLCLNNCSSITGLYKRKFDNVQEYLERKKQRLGLK